MRLRDYTSRPVHLKWLGAGGFIGAFDESDAFIQTQFVGGVEHGVEDVLLGFFEAGFDDAGGALRDEGGGVGGFADFGGAEVVAIGVAGAFAGDDADSGAHADAFGGAFDDLLVDAEGAGGEVSRSWNG